LKLNDLLKTEICISQLWRLEIQDYGTSTLIWEQEGEGLLDMSFHGGRMEASKLTPASPF
jgi:hypothetical protein